MADSGNHDVLGEFVALTGATESKAQEYLTATEWNIDAAAAAYFQDQEEGIDEAGPEVEPEPEYTGPRTLDGRPAPQSAFPASSTSKPLKKKGLATLDSLGGSSARHSGHQHEHDEDEDDEDDEDFDERKGPRDLFAGGEKLGLAVQDPAQRGGGAKKIINDIISKAKQNAQRGADAQAGPSRSSHFHGAGQTLGGDGVPSRSIPDPTVPPQGSRAQPPAGSEQRQQRTLHIWLDGFSIDDGELLRYDDPANARDLQMIQQGQAPLHLMNVNYDQAVDVNLQQHKENYRPLPKKYKPFGGAGRRLGSPVPGESSIAPPPPSTGINTTTTTTYSAVPWTSTDESQPTLMLRIQMPDGTRLPARFNTTQTVGDVYTFIERASTAVHGRPWVLMTTFPSREHTDRSLILGEMAEFKKGATAVVKWA